MGIAILPMTRLGLVPYQDLVLTFRNINRAIKEGKKIYQLHKKINLKTEKFPEGHQFFPGCFLFDDQECDFGDSKTDRLIENKLPLEMVLTSVKLANRIAFLNGKNCAPFCSEPFEVFFNAYGVEATFIGDEEVRQGRLKDYDLLIVPGGPDAGESYYEGLGDTGYSEIRSFISNGGVYLGSCAGSYFPLSGAKGTPMEQVWLNLVPVTDLEGLDYWRTGTGFVRLSVEDINHPVMYGLAMGVPSTLDMIYWEGPAFHIIQPDSVKLIATYKDYIASGSHPPTWDISCNPIAEEAMKWYNPLTLQRFNDHLKGKGAIIEAQYGKGHMILLSPHAEFGTCGTSPTMEGNPNFLLLMNSLYHLSNKREDN
jgi:hypothetical protein